MYNIFKFQENQRTFLSSLFTSQPAKKLKGFSTVRARLAHGWLGHSTCKTSVFWLEILLKIKPNEKCENLNFSENLKIWLEVFLKIKPNEKYENLKFCENL